VEHGGRTVRVRTLPIGIPFDRFEKMALEAPERSFDSKIKVRERENCHVGIAVD